jgi:hypothetical protein
LATRYIAELIPLFLRSPHVTDAKIYFEVSSITEPPLFRPLLVMVLALGVIAFYILKKPPRQTEKFPTK